MTDVDSQPCAVDEQMHRPIRDPLVELALTKLLQTPGERRVIGNRQVHVEQLGQGTQEALGLAQRQVEDHADRQRRLDRDIRVPSLATRLAGGRRPAGGQGFIG